MKSPFHSRSVLLFAASMPLLSSGFFASNIALAIGSDSGSGSLVASVPMDRVSTSEIPAESARGKGATVTPVSVQRAVDVHNPTLSTFLVSLAPGGSVVLHREPSHGYVLVHVLSGGITAWAWKAQVGIYRTGETWAEPAFAYDIAVRNASARAPAEALVVVIADDAGCPVLHVDP